METSHVKRLPPKTRRGIMVLISAWAFLIFSQAVLYGSISLLQLTIGLFCCILVYSLKNWGRILCVVYNFLLIGNSLYTLYNYFLNDMPHLILYGMHAVNIILFGTATYLLLKKAEKATS